VVTPEELDKIGDYVVLTIDLKEIENRMEESEEEPETTKLEIEED